MGIHGVDETPSWRGEKRFAGNRVSWRRERANNARDQVYELGQEKQKKGAILTG
jgi:hypothetical protein